MKSYLVSRQVAFIKHPMLSGLWMRTHSSVLISRCPLCNALIGEPCRKIPSGWKSVDDAVSDQHIYQAVTHAVRREAAKNEPLSIHPIEIQLHQGDEPA